MFTYLASPYTSPDELTRLRRFRQVRRVAGLFALAGVPVYSPIVHGHTINHEIGPLIQGDVHGFWMTQCEPFVRQAERLVILTLEGWDMSLGVTYEARIARFLNKPILNQDPETIPRRTSEAITYLRDRYLSQPATPGVRPDSNASLAGVDPDPRAHAPDSAA